jgi:hypothetical protein
VRRGGGRPALLAGHGPTHLLVSAPIVPQVWPIAHVFVHVTCPPHPSLTVPHSAELGHEVIGVHTQWGGLALVSQLRFAPTHVPQLMVWPQPSLAVPQSWVIGHSWAVQLQRGGLALLSQLCPPGQPPLSEPQLMVWPQPSLAVPQVWPIGQAAGWQTQRGGLALVSQVSLLPQEPQPSA